jgi:NADH:ubiquinone oxidoreductase subunit 4 (subunit M)
LSRWASSCFSALGVEGALVQMISHGFVSGAMFFSIGVMYDRAHSRQIADYGGVVNTMPKFAAFFMLFAMANAGLPATSGFVGEFMVILAAVEYNFWVAFAAASTMIVGAAYTLWMYKRVVFWQRWPITMSPNSPTSMAASSSFSSSSPLAHWAWDSIRSRLRKSCTAR